jgi:hypothetical protein
VQVMREFCDNTQENSLLIIKKMIDQNIFC